jgi:hypothetical protein
VSTQVGGQKGRFLYFEIASLVTCQCDSADSHMETLYWPKIKEGYATLAQLYGYSNLKMNRFVQMAVEAHDRTAAHEVFAAIGDDWIILSGKAAWTSITQGVQSNRRPETGFPLWSKMVLLSTLSPPLP